MKDDAVFDASPLIFGLKVPALFELWRRRFARAWVPDAVYAEAVEKARETAEGKRAEELFASGFLKRTRAPPMALDLGKGESEAIALARQKKCMLICDDRKALVRARALGVSVAPTSAFLVWAVRRKLWAPARALGVLEELVRNDYYLHASVYVELQKRIREGG